MGNPVRRAICSGSIIIGSIFAVSCGGGGSHSAMLPLSSQPVPVSSASLSPNHGSAKAIFTFLVPTQATAPTAVTSQHAPQYIPATVQSVQFKVLEIGGSVPVPTPTPASFTIPGSVCTLTSGNYQCTLAVQMPIGNDLTQISTYDGSVNLLSQQVGAPFSVVAGTANTFGTSLSPITLDANPSTITAIGGTGVTGSQPSFTVQNTSAVTFALSQVDAHGTAFGAQPGQPTVTHAAATGTGASASITGSTLTLTPPSSGSSTNVAVEADPAGTQDVTTTLTSSPASSATSFTVASASGIYPGANLILDYEIYSGTTFLQESALVTNVSGTTITIASGLAHAHTLGAGVRHYSDNLISSADPFTVGPPPFLIMVIAENSMNDSKAVVYNGSLTLQPGTSSAVPPKYFHLARLDAGNNLYIADEASSAVYRSLYTPGTGFGLLTTYSGVLSNQQGAIGFDVSKNGTVAIENNAFESPELTTFAPGTNSGPSTFTTSTLSPSTWPTVTLYPIPTPTVVIPTPTVAVLTDGSSNVFGYAYEVYNENGTVHDQIVVTSGSSEQDINSNAIVSNFSIDPGAAVLTWDQGRQSLIYVNSNPGGGSTYSILEFPRVGTTGAVLSTSPTTIASVAGYPLSVVASKDGTNVAVAWNNNGPTSISTYHNNGTTWSLASGSSFLGAATFANYTSMHFLPNGNLLIADSNHSYANLWQVTAAGVQVGSVYNAGNDLGTAYEIFDLTASP